MKFAEALNLVERLKVFEGQQDEGLQRTVWKVVISPNIKNGLKQVIDGCKTADDFDLTLCAEVLSSNPHITFRVTVLYTKNAAKHKVRAESLRKFIRERNILL